MAIILYPSSKINISYSSCFLYLQSPMCDELQNRDEEEEEDNEEMDAMISMVKVLTERVATLEEERGNMEDRLQQLEAGLLKMNETTTLNVCNALLTYVDGLLVPTT